MWLNQCGVVLILAGGKPPESSLQENIAVFQGAAVPQNSEERGSGG